MTNLTVRMAEGVSCPVVERVTELEKQAFGFIQEALHFYKANEMMVSFNGGKDCTVLLHIIAKFFDKNPFLLNGPLPVLYIESDDSFREIEEVIQICEASYNIDLIRCKGCIKDALAEVLSMMPHIKAVFMGTRRTDPFCEKLTRMQATDPGWPSLMRFMPLIDWKYKDIWNYIFVHDVPYCKLYDRGYTSLGGRRNTLPNPHLRIVDKNTLAVRYQHASKLTDCKLERAGRTSVSYAITCNKDEKK